MKTILIVNAGSSSLKSQVFALDVLADLKCVVKGQIDGIGTRPRLRARAADERTLIDHTYTSDQVIDAGHMKTVSLENSGRCTSYRVNSRSRIG